MSSLFYTETESVNPYYNLAFEEYILTTKTEGNYIILWQNDNTVVIGRNQNTVEEINSAFVDEHDINVVRRNTGGGAVYHDLGNLNYSFICDAGDVETMTLERFTTPIVKALKSLGLYAEASGRNDILVNGCKIAGSFITSINDMQMYAIEISLTDHTELASKLSEKASNKPVGYLSNVSKESLKQEVNRWLHII